MMHNTQASKLAGIQKKITTSLIAFKKEQLKKLQKKSLIKIESKKLEVFLKEENQTIKGIIFFQNGYFYIKNSSFTTSKEKKKISKNSFLLHFNCSVPFALGRYLLAKESLSCFLLTKNKEYNATLLFRKDAFFIEIEG